MTDAAPSDRGPLIRRHDLFFKQVLDEPGKADLFLRERLPPALVAHLSAKPAEDRSESHIPAGSSGERRGDRVYRLETADGLPVLIYTLIEHKSAPDSDLLRQILRNLSGMAERGAVPRADGDGRTHWVPALVIPFVFYHGGATWRPPLSLAEAHGLPAALAGIGALDFGIIRFDPDDIDDAELSRDPEMRAALLVLKYGTRDADPDDTLVRLAHMATGVGLNILVFAVRYLLGHSDQLDRDRLRRALAVVLPGQEDTMLSIAAREIMAETANEVRAQERSMLLWLLEDRSGTISQATAERIRRADFATLKSWLARIREGEQLQDVVGTDVAGTDDCHETW